VKRSSPLQFITITDPNQSGAANNRKLVRAQAMRHARQRPAPRIDPVSRASSTGSDSPTRSATKSPRGGFLDLPADAYEGSFQVNLSGSHDDAFSAAEYEDAEAVRYYSRDVSPLTPLGAGRVDPFASYSIEIKPYMNFLVDHCKCRLLCS
jgi:hypothetical protein